MTLLLVLPATAHAHPAQVARPGELAGAWSTEPWSYLLIGLAALAYRAGLRALWARAGVGRGISERRALLYAGGLVALVVALVSPLDAVSGALFSAHMVQHLVLTLVAAPLLAAGAPLTVALWALPARARAAFRRGWARWRGTRAAARALGGPVGAWTLHAAVLWLWHLPPLYDLAVRSDAAHALEHATFLLTATLFWWVVLPYGGRLRRSHGAGALYVFTFAMQGGVLGALLTLGSHPWYDAHRLTTAAWGLTPLEDQQLAGAIMWVPGSAPYLAALAWLMLLWLREADRRILLRERLAPPRALRIPHRPMPGG